LTVTPKRDSLSPDKPRFAGLKRSANLPSAASARKGGAPNFTLFAVAEYRRPEAFTQP
jgi:hypothetical protein